MPFCSIKTFLNAAHKISSDEIIIFLFFSFLQGSFFVKIPIENVFFLNQQIWNNINKERSTLFTLYFFKIVAVG